MSTPRTETPCPLTHLCSITKSTLTLKHLIEYRDLPNEIVDLLSEKLLDIGSDSASSESIAHSTKALLQQLVERHPTHVEAARLVRSAAGKAIPETLLDQDSSAVAFVNAYSADSAARIRSIAPILSAMGVKRASSDADSVMEAVETADKESAIEKVQLLLSDTEETVIAALYEASEADASTFIEVLTPNRYITAVEPAFVADKPNPAVRLQHLRFLAKHLSTTDAKISREVYNKLIFPNLLTTKTRPSFSQAEVEVIAGTGSFLQPDLVGSEPMVATLKDTTTGVARNLAIVDAISSKS